MRRRVFCHTQRRRDEQEGFAGSGVRVIRSRGRFSYRDVQRGKNGIACHMPALIW